MDLQKSILWRNSEEGRGGIKEKRVDKTLGIFLGKYVRNICVRR